LNEFQVACLDEEKFLKQKSKVHWLATGDLNTAYFRRVLKTKNHRSRVDVIKDGVGRVHEGINAFSELSWGGG
jgi:hypothetical protein